MSSGVFFPEKSGPPSSESVSNLSLSTLSIHTKSIINEELRQANEPQVEVTLLAVSQPPTDLRKSSVLLPVTTRNNPETVEAILERQLRDYNFRYMGFWVDQQCGDEFDSYSGITDHAYFLQAAQDEKQIEEARLEERQIQINPTRLEKTLEQARLEQLRLKEALEQARIERIRLEQTRTGLQKIRTEQTRSVEAKQISSKFACRFDGPGNGGCEKEFGKNCDRLKHEKDQHGMHGCSALLCKYGCGKQMGGTRKTRMKEHERHCKRMSTITRKMKLHVGVPLRVYEEN